MENLSSLLVSDTKLKKASMNKDYLPDEEASTGTVSIPGPPSTQDAVVLLSDVKLAQSHSKHCISLTARRD